VRAVVYARVSSAAQRERETIASQLRVLPEFVAARGWDLVAPATTYVDDGRTAKAGHLEARLGLSALLRDAALGKFDVVVVVDIDRLTRSEDLTERGAILGALQRAKVKVASATSGQVLDLSTSTGDLFTTLHAFFAAEWTRKHRERVTQGKITGIQRNRKPAGRIAYGLDWERETNEWSLDPERSPIVKEIYLRVAAGESCRAIADDLHARGAPRPLGEWNRSRVNRIVRSTYATGVWVVDKTRNLSITVPAIVDVDLWERAQTALSAHGKRALRKTRHEYLLEGRAVCGTCGSPIGIQSAIYDPRRGGRWSPATYLCRSRRIFRGAGEHRCMAPRVTCVAADETIWRALVSELEDPALAEHIEAELVARARGRKDWQADADGYRAHLERLTRVETGVLERYRRNLISDGALEVELAKLKRERDAVRAQLETAKAAADVDSNIQVQLDDARRVLEELRGVLADADFAVRRQLLERLTPEGGVTFLGDRLRLTLLVPRGAARPRRVLLAQSISSSSHENTLRITVISRLPDPEIRHCVAEGCGAVIPRDKQPTSIFCSDVCKHRTHRARQKVG
jgi:site-specific DNA recombinase